MANYTQFVAAFNDVLPRLITQRQSTVIPKSQQSARLTKLGSVQVVGPGLTAAYKIDYNGDTLYNLPKDSANKGLWDTLWFQADGGSTPKAVAQTFFDNATVQKVLLSSHVYDERLILADGVTTLDALAGLKNLFQFHGLSRARRVIGSKSHAFDLRMPSTTGSAIAEFRR